MNYINRLQTERAEHAEQSKAIEDSLQSFLELLHSPKFTGIESDGGRKDWISTSDVLNIIIPLRNSANALTQDLERK
jgi:hypothetical protein